MTEPSLYAELCRPGPVGRSRRGSRLAASAAALLLAAAAMLAAIGCSEERPAETAAAPTAEESFTFYDLGAHSVFSEAVRRRLRDQLGNEAISHRSIVDLETTAPGFLAAHLPELDLLNRRLNDPPGERVDHEVVKLMYRYARQRNVPFDYVELVFSGFSQRPILFHIRFKADEAATVEALRRRHGEPQVIDWGGGGQSLVWRREGERLIVSRVPDRLGEIGHRISFYFTANIEEMLEAERKEREQKALERQKTGRTAF
jgi:hypothetical protein